MLTIDQQIIEQVDKASRILITFSKEWFGDPVASSLALKAWLVERGKTVDIVAEKPNSPSSYSFLPNFQTIAHQLDNVRKFIVSLNITNAAVDQVEYRLEKQSLDFIVTLKSGLFTPTDISSRSSDFRYNLIFVIGTGDLESLGEIYNKNTEFFFKTPIINIDHNPANENFGQINSVNVKAVSVTEILYDLFSSHGEEKITEDIATCLLTGLITETKSFKTPHITPHALTVASKLVTIGGRREEIINALYRSRQLNVLKLWGRVLTGLKEKLDGRLVWSIIKTSDFNETTTSPNHLADIIDELIINMPNAEIIVLIYEEDMKTQVIVHSVRNLNALELTENFKGQGSRNLAHISLAQPLTEASQSLITEFEKKIALLKV
ncbi:MAG TPA: hypothetical protein PK720_00725 [bacterium]|nr:hypothetical protein [bacterium]